MCRMVSAGFAHWCHERFRRGGYAYGQFAALVTYKYSTFGPPGGGSKSLRVLQHKTVGPSRVKNRKIEGPGVPGP